MTIAAEKGLSSIAFPAISTGVYGYPKEEAARIAVETVAACLQELEGIRKVYLVAWDRGTATLYQEQLDRL